MTFQGGSGAPRGWSPWPGGLRMSSRGGGPPAAVTAAALLGVAFQLHRWDYDPDAEPDLTEAAEGLGALGIDASRVYEALVASLDVAEPGTSWRREPSARRTGRVVVALVPANLELDLEALARHCGAASTELLEAWPAERLTGTLPGGLSPIGLPPSLDVMVDHRVMDAATVLVNAGRRGLSMELRPTDLLSVSGASLAPLAM